MRSTNKRPRILQVWGENVQGFEGCLIRRVGLEIDDVIHVPFQEFAESERIDEYGRTCRPVDVLRKHHVAVTGRYRRVLHPLFVNFKGDSEPGLPQLILEYIFLPLAWKRAMGQLLDLAHKYTHHSRLTHCTTFGRACSAYEEPEFEGSDVLIQKDQCVWCGDRLQIDRDLLAGPRVSRKSVIACGYNLRRFRADVRNSNHLFPEHYD